MYATNGTTFTSAAFANQSLLISSGFQSGINTLDFIVTNDVQATSNPTGLRVALSGDAGGAPITSLYSTGLGTA